MRKDLFYDYGGNPRHIDYVGSYCGEDNYETLSSYDSGNARLLMSKLSLAESEIDQSQISQNIYNLTNSFVKLDLQPLKKKYLIII